MTVEKRVLSLLDRLPARSAPNADAIELLRRHLGMAERGELMALAVVGVTADGELTHDITEDLSNVQFHALNSGLSLMQHRLNATAVPDGQ